MLDSFVVSYHGTIDQYAENILRDVNLKAGRTFTDFGQGFYITKNYKQAKEWAVQRWKEQISIRPGVKPSVVKLILNISSLEQLKGLLFEKPDDNWAEFVYNCRKEGRNSGMYHDFDFVCGPLADGKFFPVFKKYLDGKISFSEYFAGIKPISKDHNQLSFHTIKSKSCIDHLEVETLETISIR